MTLKRHWKAERRTAFSAKQTLSGGSNYIKRVFIFTTKLIFNYLYLKINW